LSSITVRIQTEKQNPRIASHRRTVALAMVALLASFLGWNPIARAQHFRLRSGVSKEVQSAGNNSTQKRDSREAIGLLVALQARPGKEADAEAFLKSAQPLAQNEEETLKWYAIKLGPGKFGIFDTFANEGDRNAHLSGEIAKALGARANELFAVAPQVEKVNVLASTSLKDLEAIGLLVTLETRPGKEADAGAFLKSAQPLAQKEEGTSKWYAIKLGPGKFGIFDTFSNETGRSAHLSGEIAKALGARANELFAVPPRVEKVEVLASAPLRR